MNGGSKLDTLNQFVRALCVLQLVAVFCFGFAWSIIHEKIAIDGAAFIGVLSVAMTWWFASRQQTTRASDGAPVPPTPPPTP